jgi:predicted nucleic acid-binding protein
VYLADTEVFSELARAKCDSRVGEFFASAVLLGHPVYLSVVTVGELERGVRMLAHRGDERQAGRLAQWLARALREYEGRIVDFGLEEALAWAKLRVPRHENAVDKMIAATALARGWTVVTRNVAHFRGLGVALHDPFGGR